MTQALEPGSIFAGHRIEAELGRGGMAVVYRATHLALERVRALKVLAPELSGDAVYAARFRRESRLAAAIEHPNVVTVHHAGEEDGRLYLTMRFIDGVDLERMLADGPLSPARALAIVSGLAAGLDAAHAVGLVHRDVKPANALIEGERESERVYLTDFGISKLLAPSSEPGESERPALGLTTGGAILGTADYMAPEQIEGGELDARADIYSLACLAYHALAGEPPFSRPTPMATLTAHSTAPRPSARQRRAQLPEALDQALAAGMAIDPAARPRSAGTFAAELRQALATVAPTGTDGPRDPTAAPTRPLRAEPRQSRRPISRRLAVAAVAMAVAALAAAGILLLGGDQDGDEPGPGGSTATPAGERLAKIPVSRGPVALAAGPDTVWVASRNADVVRPIDPVLDEAGGPRLGVSHPRSVAIGFGSVWVVDEDRLLRFGPGEGDEPGRGEPVAIDGFDDPSDVAVGRDSVWVTDRGVQGRVVQVDPERNEIAGEAVVGRDPRAVAADRGSVWVANAGEGTVVEVDPDRARTLARPIRVGEHPTDLAIGAGAVWVIDNYGGTLTRVDTETRQVGEPITTGARPRGITLGYGSVWVAAGGLHGSVWRHDESDGAPIGEPIRVGEDPADIDTSAGSVWTADYGKSAVSRIEP